MSGLCPFEFVPVDQFAASIEQDRDPKDDKRVRHDLKRIEQDHHASDEDKCRQQIEAEWNDRPFPGHDKLNDLLCPRQDQESS